MTDVTGTVTPTATLACSAKGWYTGSLDLSSMALGTLRVKSTQVVNGVTRVASVDVSKNSGSAPPSQPTPQPSPQPQPPVVGQENGGSWILFSCRGRCCYKSRASLYCGTLQASSSSLRSKKLRNCVTYLGEQWGVFRTVNISACCGV